MKSIKILLIALFSIVLNFSFAQKQKKNAKKTIVFVCEHGAGRSTIASAYFNKLAKENHLNYQATFRGLVPDSSLSEVTKNGLIKDGFDIKGWKPSKIDEKSIEMASQIITLNCDIEQQSGKNKTTYSWKNIPGPGNNYEVARDSIYLKIEGLVKELKKKSNLR